MSKRPRDIGRIAAYLKRYESPRVQLFFILVATGFVGAVASFVLLRLGVLAMWLRYPLAALIAYATFLSLLRSWARRLIVRPELIAEIETHPPTKTAKHDSPQFSLTDVIDLIPSPADEGWLLLFVGLVIVVILVAAVVAAPVILAEVLLDALLVAGLWRRFTRRKTATIQGALKTTVVPAIIVIVCLGIIGYLIQIMEPSVDSIGDLFRTP